MWTEVRSLGPFPPWRTGGTLAAVAPTRIVFVDLKPLTRGVMRALFDRHPGRVAVVGEFGADVALGAALDRGGGELVIVESEAAEAQIEPLLRTHPHARILGIENDGRRSFLWELRPHRSALGEVSPDALLDALDPPRSAAR
jgi:hypothetical protein